jgi:cytoskeleton-associated protein 5
VFGKMIAIFQLFAEQSPSFSKACAAITIPSLSDKLGDMKLKKPAGDTLLVYAEKTSLQFVLSIGTLSLLLILHYWIQF